MVFKMMLLVILSWLFTITLADPIILEETGESCKLLKKENTLFPGKLQKASTDKFDIFFNLCGTIPEEYCGKNTSVCVRNRNTNSVFLSGTGFKQVNDNLLQLNVTSSSKCEIPAEVFVSFEDCTTTVAKPRLELTECEFRLRITKPNCKCATNINGRSVDLRRLRGTYRVQSKNFNFSVGICKVNDECKGDGVSICRLEEGDPVHLASESELFEYVQNRNEIRVYGHSKGRNKAFDKRTEIFMKCRWDRPSPELHYIEPQKQGKIYKFEMETSYGCVKPPPQCTVNKGEDFFYDFTSLSKNGSWEITVNPRRKILLNVCGNLVLSAADNKCAETHAQVCEITDGQYTSWGMAQMPIEISDDAVSTSFINGAACAGDPAKLFETRIEFRCDRVERGPIFVKSEKCQIIVEWSTPAACPRLSGIDCSKIHHDYRNCSLEHMGDIYDLSPLTKRSGKYVVKDPNNPNLEYLVNVCGPVVDEEVPCSKEFAVVAKHLNEYSLSKRITSFGKTSKMYVREKNVVIETVGGVCMDGPNLLDYKSVTHFECSDHEEVPKISKKTKCTVEFIWKTPVACSVNNQTKCIFRHPRDEHEMIDFGKLRETSLKVQVAGKEYVFDLCKGKNTNYDVTESTIYLPVYNSITYGNQTHLEFTLNRTCTSNGEFNRTLLKLVCDPISNNDHYIFKGIKDCRMMFELSTHLTCSTKVIVIPSTLSELSTEGAKYVRTLHSPRQINELQNCSVVNPHTGYIYQLDNLKLKVASSKCPSYAFDYVNKYTELTHLTDLPCYEGLPDNVTYSVKLKCADKLSNNSVKTACREQYLFEGPVFCKLLEDAIINNISPSSVAGITVGVIAATLTFLGIVSLGVIKCRRRRARSYDSIYTKDGDL